ncbi:MAG TPA: cytochrome c [Rhodanobacteraceae bacterium]|nr:cytochrome c [Rhodanobacteraceae bacterium]
MRKSVFVVGLVAACGLAATAAAAIKPSTAIHYRQSVYHVILWNFAPLADMVKGKTAFDAKEFARRADRIAFLTPQLLEGFPPGSDAGAKTEAKPDIWKNFPDFQSKMKTLVLESKALAEVAGTGDEAKMKAQFRKTAGACKSCHDKYREEE